MNASMDQQAKPKYSVIDQIWDRKYAIWTAPPELPKQIAESSSQLVFVAMRRISASTNNAEPFTHIELKDLNLTLYLRGCLPSESALFNKPPTVDAQLIYVSRHKIVEALSRGTVSEQLARSVTTLLDFVKGEYIDVEDKLQSLPSGQIAWPLLWLLFEVGQEVEAVYENTGERMAFRIDGWAYGMTPKGRSFELHGHAYQWTGVKMQKIRITRKVIEFTNLRPIAGLSIRPLAEINKKLLDERGITYMQNAKQIFCAYVGSFVLRAHAASVRLNGDGRVMVDVRQYRRSVPVLDIWEDDVNTTEADLANVADDLSWDPANDLHLLPPILHGFSFVHKKWGEFSVTNLREVTWTNAPFEHLVIPDNHREVVRSLIEVHSTDLKTQLLADVVQGKSTGCIMALYGNPGCGKTLTAEAVAEHLRRPLYSISAGELGTAVSSLENNLKTVLELATYWNAVLLIDEADVFLEKRSSHELERNGLVSIFLRVLEYFSGILILTTNRLESFDTAFLSRFSLILRYPDLGPPSRRVLWDRFLNLAAGSSSSFDLDWLASFELNGRAIKQSVRTAQALALTRKVPLSGEHIRIILDMNAGV